MVICSASWSIKHSRVSEDKAIDISVYDNVVPDSSDFFEQNIPNDGRYDGKQHKPSITNEGAEVLYGVQTAAEAADKYTVEWQSVTYKRDLGGVQEGDGVDNFAINAGTHYYRIVDVATGTVICYKHEYTIDPDTVTATIDSSPSDPKFTWDSISHTAKWTGTNNDSGDEIEFSECKDTVAERMQDNGYSFSDYYFTETITYKPTASIKNKLFLNNHTFDVDDTKSYTYTALATAYSTPDGSSLTYHGTIVDALNTTYDKNTTVVPIQSFSHGGKTYTAGSDSANADYSAKVKYQHKIDGDCTIASNVTLLIPFSATPSDYYSFSDRKYTTQLTITQSTSKSGANYLPTSAYDNAAKYLMNSITVKSGVTLTNKGNIIIPGIITGGSGGSTIASVTATQHTRINLESNAKIQNAGSSPNIICHGYIDEIGTNSQVLIDVGNIDLVYSIVEHRGGSAFSGMLDGTSIKDCAPFTRFYIESVTSQLVIKENATAYGFCDLQMQDSHISNKIGLFGNGTSFFIGFDTSDTGTSYAYLKYNPDDDQNIMVIKGSASVNKIDVKVKYIFELTLSTKDVYLPLSHYWDATFTRFESGAAATITSTSQDLKILPGGSVTIDEGVTLKGRNLAVYTTSSPSMGNAGGFDYYAKAAEDVGSFDAASASTYKDGELIVKGTLELTGGLGGYAQAGGPNAKIKATSASVSVKEVSYTAETTVMYTPVATLTAKGDLAEKGSVTSKGALGTIQYTACTLNNKDYVWKYQHDITIKYNSDGGNAVADKTVTDVWSNVGIDLNDYISDIDGKTYYDFDSWWYTDLLGTDREITSGSMAYENITILAKWKKHTYTVTYKYVYPDGTVSDTIETESFVYTDTISPADPDAIEDYKFNGWFTDVGCTNEIESIYGEQLIEAGLVLYGNWVGDQYTITIEHIDSNKNKITAPIKIPDQKYTLDQLATATIPSMSNYDGPTDVLTMKYYFSHWELNGEPWTAGDYSFIDTSSESDIRDYTLTAVWKEKTASITYTSNQINGASIYESLVGSYGTVYYYVLGTEITLPNLTQYDTTTADEAYKYYFASWTIDGVTPSFTPNGTNTYTVNGNVTIDITWSTKLALTFVSVGPEANIYDGKITNLSYGTKWYVPTAASITLPNVYANDGPSQANKYYLASWTDGAKDFTATDKGTTYSFNKDTTITITWKLKTEVTISITLDGGSASATADSTNLSAGLWYVKPGTNINVAAEKSPFITIAQVLITCTPGTFTDGQSSKTAESRWSKVSVSATYLVTETAVTISMQTGSKLF